MNTLFLAILFFLLFSFAAKTSSSSPSAITDDPVFDINGAITDDPVFDINGDLLPGPKCQVKDLDGSRLQPDEHYFIVAAEGTELSGHVVRPCTNEKKECPPVVILDKDNTEYVTAIKFLDQKLPCRASIEFKKTINKCTGQTVWTDVPNDIPIPKTEYLLGCKKEVSTSMAWFQFVKDETYNKDAYKIFYFKNNEGFNVSYVRHYSKSFLALNQTLDDESKTLYPLVVQFRKAGGANEKPLNPVLKNISTEMPTVQSVA